MNWKLERTGDEKFPFLINDEKGDLVAKIAMATKTKVQQKGLGFTKAADYKEDDIVKTETFANYMAATPQVMALVEYLLIPHAIREDKLEIPEWVKAAEKTGASLMRDDFFIPDN